MSVLAWRMASASLTAPAPPPATAGAFAQLAANDPGVCGKPDSWSLS
jgi:hypothetical protein